MHSLFKPKPAWADFPCNSPFFSPNLLQLGFLQRTQSLCYFHSHHQLLQNKQGNWKYQSISGFERMKVNVLNTEAENNVLVSTTHHHSWELSIPICNTSAAPAVTIKHEQKSHCAWEATAADSRFDLQLCCKGVSKCCSLEITQRSRRDRMCVTLRGSGGYLEAAYDLWTIAPEIGSWRRSNNHPRALGHFGIRSFFLQGLI